MQEVLDLDYERFITSTVRPLVSITYRETQLFVLFVCFHPYILYEVGLTLRSYVSCSCPPCYPLDPGAHALSAVAPAWSQEATQDSH